LKVTASGAAGGVGVLPDNANWFGKPALEIRVLAALCAGLQSQGSVIGYRFDTNASLRSGWSVDWFRPSQTTRLYPAGFTNRVFLRLALCRSRWTTNRVLAMTDGVLILTVAI
jgi:hypothetical protein